MKKKLQDELTKQKDLRENVKFYLGNLPSDFLKGATDYVESQHNLSKLLTPIIAKLKPIL